MSARDLLAVGLGAALGAMLRFLLTLVINVRVTSFPLATLVINVLGSVLLGLLYTALPASEGTAPARLLLGTGLLGGFTTFSTFSYEVLHLLTAGRTLAAGIYIGGSVGGGLLGCWVGILLGEGIR